MKDYELAMAELGKIEKLIITTALKIGEGFEAFESPTFKGEAEENILLIKLSLLHHFYHNQALLWIQWVQDYEKAIVTFEKAIQINDYCIANEDL